MKSTLRLYAAVKPGRYLESGTPTGITGLLTHPSPRSQLLFVYASTLEKLQSFPESSVYRQSTEALTKHRMNIVEQIRPAGYEEWRKRAAETIEKNPDLLKPGASHRATGRIGEYLYLGAEENDDRNDLEWDGESVVSPQEGIKGEREARVNTIRANREDAIQDAPVAWEHEPALEAAQISEVETQIGAGLIEEVIQVAEGELELVETMRENKVWEELEEKAPAGQWAYFARRDEHTPLTQEVPNK